MNANDLRHLRALAARRAKLDADTDAAIRRLVRQGDTTRAIAAELGVSHATVSRRSRVAAVGAEVEAERVVDLLGALEDSVAEVRQGRRSRTSET